MSRNEGSDMPLSLAQPLVGSETLAAIQPVAYPAGTILFREHQIDDRLYIVLSGEVALVSGLDTADEHIRHVRGSGELVGELSFFNPDWPHRTCARVERDAQLLVLNRANIDAVLRREPLLAYEMLRVASGHIHRTHNRAMRALEEKTTQLAEAYTALQDAQARLLQQERVEHELQLAREIQQGMLPRVLPDVAGIDLGVWSIPAYEVGGDFFDIFVLDDETLGVMIGDVVGKGIPAALYMAQTRSLIRAEALQSTSPATVLRRVNAALQALNSGTMFVTVLYGRLQHATRTLITARAGHEYPLVWAADGSELIGARAVGQPLGLLAEPALDVQARTLLPGDTLVLYTDGVTDTTNAAGDFFAQEGVKEAVRSAGATTAQELCDHIVQRLVTFQGAAQQPDDITLVVVRAY